MTRAGARWICALTDASRPLVERAVAARALAVLSTDAALAALATSLESGTAALRAVIAEALGLAAHPRALALLTALLQDPDGDVACAAIRALAWRREEETLAELAPLLDGAGASQIRCEAARALAMVAGRDSADAFAGALVRTAHEDTWDAALTVLAARPLRDTREVFDRLLRATDGARRAAVLDALGEAPGDVAGVAAPWLDDPSSAVREAAALAMAASPRAGDAGPVVVAALERERETAVRAALFQALANQLAIDAERAARLARAEASLALRLAGFAALAMEIGRRRATIVAFDSEVVPELAARALAPDAGASALAAVRALHAAGTRGARRALAAIARAAGDPGVAVAARAAAAEER